MQSIVYDASSRVTSYSNGVGTWSYAYATSGGAQTVTITDPNANRRTVVSNPSLDVITSSTDALNRTTTYAYDTYGRLTQVTHPHGDAVQYVYDAHGNVTQTTQVPAAGSGLSNIVTSATYPCATVATCNKPATTTDARGNVTTYTYDTSSTFTPGGTGGLTSVTYPAQGPNNVQPQTRYTYTSEQASLANGVSGTPIYLLTGVSSCNGKSATGSGNCIGTSDETRITIAYDATHNLAPSSITTAAGDGSVTSTQSFTYDSVGNPYTSTSPLGAVTRYRYDADRELVGVVGADPDGGGSLVPTAARLTYDSYGRLAANETGTVPSQSDSDWSSFSQAHYVYYLYDTLGRLTETYRAAPSAGVYSATQYAYDNANRLTFTAVRLNMGVFSSFPAASSLSTVGLDGSDRITSNIYNTADQLVQQIDGYATPQQRYVFNATLNADGDVGSVADGKGNKSCYVYDGFNRRTSIQYPTPSNGATCNTADYDSYTYASGSSNLATHRLRDGTTFSYTYDALERPTSDGTTSLTYDNIGRIKASGSVSFTYDALGRKLTETGPSGKTMTSAYDAAGNRTRLTWPDGTYVAYVHDPLGRVTQIGENGATSGAGDLAAYTYNSLGQATNVVYAGNSAVLGQGFAYDPMGRLSMVGYGFYDSSKNTYLGLSYTADSRLKVRTQSNSLYDWTGPYNTTTYGLNGVNQVTSNGAAFSYDARGGLHSDSVNTYSYNYNSYSRLTAVSGSANANLTYDGLQRLSQTQGSATTQFVYDGSMITEELDGSGNLLRRYVPGPDGAPLLWYEGSGLTDRRWLLKDQQGSVIAVANASGQARDIYAYDPNGIAGTPWSGNQDASRHLYAGYPFVPETGLYNTGARAYSPALGRFLQTDPAGYGDGMNWYVYTHGDPVNGTDPSGLDAVGDDTSTVVVTAIDNLIQEAARLFGPAVSAFSGFSGNNFLNTTTSEVVVTGHRPHPGKAATPKPPPKQSFNPPSIGGGMPPEYQPGPDGRPQITPQAAKNACANYHAVMASADNIAYGTAVATLPGGVAAGAAKGGMISGTAQARSFGILSLMTAFSSVVAATLEKFLRLRQVALRVGKYEEDDLWSYSGSDIMFKLAGFCYNQVGQNSPRDW